MKYLTSPSQIIVHVKPDLGARVGHSFAEWNTGRIIARENGALFSHRGLGHSAQRFNSILGLDLIPTECDLGNADLIIYPSDYEQISATALKANVFESTAIVLDFFLSQLGPIYDQTALNGELLSLYRLAKETCPCFSFNYSPKDRTVIAIHLRKGDVSNEEGRQASSEFYQRALEAICKTQDSQLIIPIVFTDGSHEQVRSGLPFLEKYSPIVRSRNSDIIDLTGMIESDYLIAAKSGFSYLAHLYHLNGDHIFAPSGFWHKWKNSVNILDNGCTYDSNLQLHNAGLAWPKTSLIDASVFHRPNRWHVVASDMREASTSLPAFCSFLIDDNLLKQGIGRMHGLDDRSGFDALFKYCGSKVTISRYPSLLKDINQNRYYLGGDLSDLPEECWSNLEISTPSILIREEQLLGSSSCRATLEIGLILAYSKCKLFSGRSLFVSAEDYDYLKAHHFECLKSFGVSLAQVPAQEFVLFSDCFFVESSLGHLNQ